MPLVPVEKLRNICDPGILGCATTHDIDSLGTIIGQERAVRSLKFGLGIKDPGFNIFVCGSPGTGRTTAVKKFLEEVAQSKPVPPDWIYVYNFNDSYRPRAIKLPAGTAKVFQVEMKTLLEGSFREIKRSFESEEYHAMREESVKSFEEQKNSLLTRINTQAQQAGFFLQASPYGIMTVPVKGGKPLNEQEFMALDEKEREEYDKRREKLEDALETTLRQVKGIEKDAGSALDELDQKVARYALSHLFEEMSKKYTSLTEVVAYLDEIQKDILANLDEARGDGEEEEPDPQQAASPAALMKTRGAPLRKYEVNVLVDHSGLKGAPVIMENNPIYGHLFGRIEQEARFGALTTDFTLIRAGSLHQANGGYLVMPVEELLRSAFSWESLKRALGNRYITIEDSTEQLGFAATRSLRPEPVPLDVKVILIGTPDLYQLLRQLDANFSELFKVKADFDTRMPRTDENMVNYASFVCTVCQDEGLRHLDSAGLAKVIEHGSRMAEDQDELSTRFGEVTDIIREASFYAAQENAEFATSAHVTRAIEERFYRSALIRERVQDFITKNVIKIDVEGEKVGQINGLSVLDLGDISFGQPSRITASISLGREGVIDVEREADMSGPTHTKGVLILTGYLASKYAQVRPLSMNARLVFEQNYGGVDGDSASSTEVYAILSALSGLPIHQGIAVTGSVNQRGEVQAIGGVNEKIEGFYEICKARGLTGEQGVMIPDANVKNLMLKEEVVEAVKAGKFRIWSVGSIDEGIEILTGRKAGERADGGDFEADTVNALVDCRLNADAYRLIEFGRREVRGRKTKRLGGARQD